MYYLVAAVVVAIACTLLNLLLILGVIRKLREHDALLAKAGGHDHTDAVAPVGSTVPAVSSVALGGSPVSSPSAGSSLLVGFFSPGCGPCEELLPEFIRYQARTGLASVAVVVDEGDTGPHVARLSGHVDVVVEPAGGTFGAAFQVTSYPALCLIDSAGVVLAGGNSFDELPDLVRA